MRLWSALTAAGFIISALGGAIAANPEPELAPDLITIAGSYDMWEDVEGGTVCPTTLTDVQTSGGLALEGDIECMAKFAFDGEPQAWHIDDEGWLTIVDIGRQILVRFEPLKDGSFYANRTADQLESLNLTLAD